MANAGGMKRTRGAPMPSSTVFRKSAKRSKTENAKEDKKPGEKAVNHAKVLPAAKAQASTAPTPSQPVQKPVTKGTTKTILSNSPPQKEQTKNQGESSLDDPRLADSAQAVARSPRAEAVVTKASKRESSSPQEVQKSVASQVVPTPQTPPSGFRIVAGSYERFLYGLEGSLHHTADGTYEAQLVPRFVFPAHVSSIRSVACAGRDSKWLVTGGIDETIKVWDLRRNKEVGALTGHEGTITSLSFPSRTFLLSTSEDGTMNLYRTRDWALLRTLRGHTGRINSASAHPSGRVALSVSADRMIRLWDLMRGVGSASVKIGIEADRILWDTQGQRFAVLAGRQVMIFSTDMTKLAEVEQPKRLHDIYFLRASVHGAEHELLLVASEDGQVHVYDVDDLQETEESATPRALVRLVGHKNRVRSAQATLVCADDGTEHVVISTISSDGWIRVFDLDVSGQTLELEAVGGYDTKKSRLTCLSAVGFDPASTDATDDAQDEEETLNEWDDDEDLDADADDADADRDEDTDEELARLEEEVRQARAAGIIIEGMEEEEEQEVADEDDDDKEKEGEEEEEEEEKEDDE